MGAATNVVDNKEARLPREVKDALQSMASEWDDVVDSKALQVIPLKGAMTNEVFQIKWPTRGDNVSQKVLVRIYGEGVDVFFDREDEIRTFEFMSKHGQGPRLLRRFRNGRIEEFIRARTLSASDLRDPAISALIATRLREFHELDMPGPKKVWLWDRLRKWLKAAKRLSPLEEAKAFRLESLEEEISILEKKLSARHQRIGFCHNDLQYGNIMFDEGTKSVTIIVSFYQTGLLCIYFTYRYLLSYDAIGDVWMVSKYRCNSAWLSDLEDIDGFLFKREESKLCLYDYEYASYNPVAFDIANHFCEMAADYHTETPHVMDYSKYPGLEERLRFLRVYLNSSGKKPRDSEVQQLLQDVEKYTLASHLTWGVWGIISEHVNEIDFDYKEYAKQRLRQYWKRKPELLGSS
ncbi:putative choline kinase 2 isoform X2 [Gossypium australe]|uniref:Putative choline kinase 2 isoform X2 n=1 Tax=Gossypium australe TaxID=47621 RepID=A0A5B6WK08_9ROSI|nr:putative choline kinase 2 isoform X2 [Gossypium australe]